MVRLSMMCGALLVAPSTVAASRITTKKDLQVDLDQPPVGFTGAARLGEECNYGPGPMCPDGAICSSGKCLVQLGATCSKDLITGTSCANLAYGREAGIKCSKSAGYKCCVAGQDHTMTAFPEQGAVLNDPSDCCTGKIWDPQYYTEPMKEKDNGKGYCKRADVEPYLLPLDKLPADYVIPSKPFVIGPPDAWNNPTVYGLREACDWAHGASCPEGQVCSSGKCLLKIGQTCEKTWISESNCAVLAYGRDSGIKCSKSAGYKCCVEGMPFTMMYYPQQNAAITDSTDCCSGKIWPPTSYTQRMIDNDNGKGYCKSDKVEPHINGVDTATFEKMKSQAGGVSDPFFDGSEEEAKA